MNRKALMTAATLSLGISATASAAVLQEFAGDFTATNETKTLVDTTSDTGDWIDTYSPSSASGVLYYKFDATINNNTGETGSGGFFTGLAMFNNNSENFHVGNAWQSLNWDSFFASGSSRQDLTGPQSYVVGQKETIIVKADFNASAADDITIFFNPVAGVAEGDQAAGVTTSRTDNLTFNNFRYRAGNTTGSATYSDIVFATTFEDVNPIPEPSSALLGGLVGLLVLLRRRRG